MGNKKAVVRYSPENCGLLDIIRMASTALNEIHQGYEAEAMKRRIPPSEAEVVEKVITIPIDIEGCDKIEFIVSSSNLFVTLDKFHETVEGLKAENVPTVEELPNADAPTAPGAVIANARLYIKI